MNVHADVLIRLVSQAIPAETFPQVQIVTAYGAAP